MATLIFEAGGWYGWGWRDGGRLVLRAGIVQVAWLRGSLAAELEECRDVLVAAREKMAAKLGVHMRVIKGGDGLQADLARALDAGQSVVVVVLGQPGRSVIYTSPDVTPDHIQRCVNELLDQWVAERRQTAERIVQSLRTRDQPA